MILAIYVPANMDCTALLTKHFRGKSLEGVTVIFVNRNKKLREFCKKEGIPLRHVHIKKSIADKHPEKAEEVVRIPKIAKMAKAALIFHKGDDVNAIHLMENMKQQNKSFHISKIEDNKRG